MTPATRTCAKTGLALVASPVRAYRIARSSYGPLAPPPREPDGDVRDWSRYDTIGRTVYASAEKLSAYMEMLAPYRTKVQNERRALQPVADFMGIALDDMWNDIVAEWHEAGNMKASWLPQVFREGRGMYTLRFPEGWWIDVTAIETISALHELFDGTWPTSNGQIEEPLTLAHLTGDDRVLTTAIATELRENITLDDGTLPLGIQFVSKHGVPAGQTGQCWAYWMRSVDSGLDDATEVLASEGIELNDPDFVAAQEHCKIKSR